MKSGHASLAPDTPGAMAGVLADELPCRINLVLVAPHISRNREWPTTMAVTNICGLAYSEFATCTCKCQMAEDAIHRSKTVACRSKVYLAIFSYRPESCGCRGDPFLWILMSHKLLEV